MGCEHKRVRCTDGVFFCLECGAQVASPFEVKDEPPVAEKAAEAPKKGAKRTTKRKGVAE